MRLLRPLLVVLLITLPAKGAPVNFPDVVVFGDSLSDVGNTANHPLAPFASLFTNSLDAVTNGRFSNGPVWVEYLSTKLGLPGSASSRSDTGGDNYAHGGAQTGSGTLSLGVIDNVGRQVSNYTGANTPAGNELFVVWAGGNDLLDGANAPTTIRDNMSAHITALANDGAARFLVLNLPKLGDIPRNRGTANQATLNSQSSTYNSLLASEVNSLEASLGIDISLFDVETTFDRLLTDPGAFGFTNTTDPAFDMGAPNPEQYVFWDDIHPTTAAHAVLADAAFVALHDPGDFNGDGNVDQADLQIVLSNFALTTSPFNLAQGDWDGDGQVGMAEVDLVLANWTGTGAPVVPEPVSLSLFAGLALITATRSSPCRRPRRCGR